MNVSLTVTEVSVFRNGCTMKAAGTAAFPAGTSKLQIRGLSENTDPASVRVLLAEGLSGSNVQVRFPDADERSAALEELISKVDSVNARISACEVQEQIWKGNTALAGSQNFDLNMMKEYTEALPLQLARISEEKTKLNKELAELEKQRTELAEKEGCPYVELDVTCEADGTYPLAMEFHDVRASWNPSYEIRAEQEDRPLSVRLRAGIRQNTGLDWQDVSLSLYTGNPSVSADIPHMNSLHVAFETPVPRPRMMAKSVSGGGMMMASAMPMNAMEDTAMLSLSEVTEETAEKEEGETMSEYRLSGKWTINSGDADAHADLSVSEVPCSYHVVALPGISNNAYLAAELKTEDIQDILDCSASLYLNGTYSGDICIDADLSKPTYDLSLGIDETIRVSRIRKKKYSSSVLLKGQRKTEYEYEIEAVSKKKKNCRVTIVDRIPVSEEKTIIVEKGTLSGGKTEEETGIVTWDLELQPQEKKVLTLSYSVAWPKDKRITEKTVLTSARRFCKSCGAETYGMKYCPECGAPV